MSDLASLVTIICTVIGTAIAVLAYVRPRQAQTAQSESSVAPASSRPSLAGNPAQPALLLATASLTVAGVAFVWGRAADPGAAVAAGLPAAISAAAWWYYARFVRRGEAGVNWSWHVLVGVVCAIVIASGIGALTGFFETLS